MYWNWILYDKFDSNAIQIEFQNFSPDSVRLSRLLASRCWCFRPSLSLLSLSLPPSSLSLPCPPPLCTCFSAKLFLKRLFIWYLTQNIPLASLHSAFFRPNFKNGFSKPNRPIVRRASERQKRVELLFCCFERKGKSKDTIFGTS